MGKKNKKNRQESRRRYSEKKRRYSRLFDMTVAGIALLILISVLVVGNSTSLLSDCSGAGFAKWFLVVLGYLPVMIYGVIRCCCGMCASTDIWESVRVLGLVDFGFLLLIWAAIRFVGRRHSPDFTRRAWHLMLIIFYWGIFQLLCFGTALFWTDINGSDLPDFQVEDPAVIESDEE